MTSPSGRNQFAEISQITSRLASARNLRLNLEQEYQQLNLLCETIPFLSQSERYELDIYNLRKLTLEIEECHARFEEHLADRLIHHRVRNKDKQIHFY